MTPVDVHGIGFAAPGLIGWDAACACLTGAAPYTPAPMAKLAPEWLPANERRRLSHLMRLALGTGQEAVRTARVDPERLATVFASANGDGSIIHSICEELARPEPALSPTRFHNSVHNAPAGYWTIAARSRAASTAVAAHDASFSAGLIEAATLAGEAGAPVLLVAYDQPLPFPLGATRPVVDAFACALLLTPTGATEAPRLTLEPEPGEATSSLPDPALEALRAGNPAARALPLLALLAAQQNGRVSLPYVSGSYLAITVNAA